MLIWICLEIMGHQVKIVQIFIGHGSQLVRAVACYANGWEFKSFRILLQIWLLNFHLYMEILGGKFLYTNENQNTYGRMKHRLLVL
jgi:hypothetical protein